MLKKIARRLNISRNTIRRYIRGNRTVLFHKAITELARWIRG